MKKLILLSAAFALLVSCDKEQQSDVLATKETTVWYKEVTYSTDITRVSEPIILDPESVFIDIILCGTSAVDTVRTDYPDGYREQYTSTYLNCN